MGEAFARDAFWADDHHFAGLDVMQIHRADQIEGAGFGSEHIALASARDLHFAHGQRTEPVRIARHDDSILRQKHQRKRAFKLQQRIAKRSRKCALRGLRHQVQHHLGVARSLEDRAAAAQFARSSVALVMLPLCATATAPRLHVTENGCAFSSTVSPAVE